MSRKTPAKSGLLSKFSEVSDDAAAKLKGLIEGLTTIGDGAKERLALYANQVFDLSPAFEAAGYRVNRVVVGVSIPPAIEIFFSRYKELSGDELAAVRDRYRERKLFLRLLDCLAMAHSIQNRISTDNLVFTDVAIELSIPPKVSLRYHNSEIANLIDRSQHGLDDE